MMHRERQQVGLILGGSVGTAILDKYTGKTLPICVIYSKLLNNGSLTILLSGEDVRWG